MTNKVIDTVKDGKSWCEKCVTKIDKIKGAILRRLMAGTLLQNNKGGLFCRNLQNTLSNKQKINQGKSGCRYISFPFVLLYL